MSGRATIAELARGAGVAPSTLRRWIALGLIPRGADGRLPGAAAAQARVIARLRERGHRLDEIRAAMADGRLALDITEELRSGTPARHRFEDVAAQAGVEPALIRRILRAAGVGLADEQQLTDDDVDLVHRLADVLATGFPLVAVLQLARVYGQALSQIADTEVRLFHVYVHEPMLREGVPGEQIAEAMAGLARELLPLANPVIRNIHRRYLQQFVEQDRIADMDADRSAEQGRLRVALAFADLAGYVRLTEEAGEDEAVSAVERFVDRVENTLPADARVIKTIGDGIFIVGTDTGSLLQWAVAFAGAMRERPRPRIGMHQGEVLYRDGDFFGREVNLAARIAARAAGGEVLVTRAVMDHADPALSFEPIGEVALKGFTDGTEVFLARGADG